MYTNWRHLVLMDFFTLIIFVVFRVPGKSMIGYTWNPNIDYRDKQILFLGYIRDLFTIEFQE